MRRLAIVGLVLLGLAAACLAAAYRYSLFVPGRAYDGALPALSAVEADLAVRLRRHVTAVASRPHNTRYFEALQQSAAYIEMELTSFGLAVARQTFDALGRNVANIEATIDATTASAGSLVIGAHYDSAGEAPGANDNGSGVAALLELARLLKTGPPLRQRVRLVFFVNEEMPWFGTDLMGSRKYTEMLRTRGEHVSGMISLETLGAFSDAPGSQHYPRPFGLVLPDVGNFLAFVAMPGSRTFMHEVIAAFRRNAHFPTIGGVAPAFVEGIGWSDHASFAARDIPALMITDTALFRYSHYHKPTDTPDKVDYEKLARITVGLARAVPEIVK